MREIEGFIRTPVPGRYMHLKSYSVDGRVLRSGCANLSASGLKQQDNGVLIIRDAGLTGRFESRFERQWEGGEAVAGGTITYWRDARGLVTQRTDARGTPTYHTYDNAGRLTDKTYSSSTAWQSFKWGASAPDNKGAGWLVGIYSDVGLNWRTFDGKGRIWVDWRINNPAPSGVTQYRYDAAGNVSTMMYPSGRIVTYGRDAMGWMLGYTILFCTKGPTTCAGFRTKDQRCSVFFVPTLRVTIRKMNNGKPLLF